MKGQIFFVLLMLLSSCLFRDEDINLAKIPQVPDPQYMASITYSYTGANAFYPAKDTFWLAPNENVELRLSGTKVYRLVVEIDGKVVSDEENRAEVWVTNDKLASGSHTLAITQFVKSGTKSFADKLNAERTSYTTTFVLMAGEITFKPVIKSIALEDGSVKVTWNTYPRGDFQRYVIRKYDPFNNQNFRSYRELVVTDASVGSLIDETYAGGSVIYRLYVDRGEKYFQSLGYTVNFAYNPNLRLTKLDGGQVRLSWDQPPYYKGVGSIKITRSSVQIGDNIAGDQTSFDFTFDTVFGRLSEFTLRMTAKVNDPDLYVDRHSVNQRVTFGKRIPPFSDILYSSSEDVYYLACHQYQSGSFPEGVYRLDKDLNVTDTLVTDLSTADANLVQSPDGQHLYLLDQYTIYELKKDPLQIISTHQTGNSFTGSTEQSFAVSNNNFILYRHPYNLQAIDFTTRRSLVTLASTPVAHLSGDGQYLAQGDDLYQFNGTLYQLIKQLPFTNIYFLRFLPSDRLFIATGDKAIVYDYILDTTVAEHAFVTNVGSYPEFDDAIMTYTVRHDFKMVSLHLNTGEQKQHAVWQVHDSFIEGAYLFSNEGYGITGQ